MKIMYYLSWVAVIFGMSCSIYLFHLNFGVWKKLFLSEQSPYLEIPHLSGGIFIGILCISMMVSLIPYKLTKIK